MKIVLLLLLGSRRTTRGIYKPTRWDPRRGRENWPKVGVLFLLRAAFSHRLQTPASLHIQCVLVICHILKRGGVTLCPEFTRLLKFCPAPAPWSRFPACIGLGSVGFPASESFMCDEKRRRCCFAWSRSCRDKHWRPKKILARSRTFALLRYRRMSGGAYWFTESSTEKLSKRTVTFFIEP